ncbi:hypothetical protein D0T50_07610 [Bacteroides sp. 214]|nr:hypothetical protein [Bacteroides sp. 214]
MYNKLWLILVLLLVCGGHSSLRAQEIGGTQIPVDAEATYYSSLSLPPLDVLFENAKTAPAYELAEVQVLVEKSLLAKEKRHFLSWFSIRASWQWGNFQNDATFSDVYQPIVYSYTENEQTGYTIGAGLSIPLSDFFDYGPRIKRQKLTLKMTELQREIQYQALKQEILDLYLSAQSQLTIVKIRAEAVVLANIQYRHTERNFANGLTGSDALALEKEKQSLTIERYEGSKSLLTKSIMMLEILTNTPIINK